MEARGCHHNFRMFFSRRGCGWYQIGAELSITLTLIIIYLVVTMVVWMMVFWRIWMGRRRGWGWIWRVWIRGWWNSGRGRRTATNDIIRTGNGSWGFKIVSIDHGDLTWGFALGHCLQSPNCVILSGRGVDKPTWSFRTSVTWKTKYENFNFELW